MNQTKEDSFEDEPKNESNLTESSDQKNELNLTGSFGHIKESEDFQKIHLKDDPFFLKSRMDISSIVDGIKKDIESFRIKDFEKATSKTKNFIYTPGAKERLTLLDNYINAGIPVLLEGPTGTSKTLSSEIVCKLSFPQMINIIEMTSRLNINSNFTKKSKNLGLILYRIVVGLIESRKLRNAVKDEFAKKIVSLPKEILSNLRKKSTKQAEDPLVVTVKDGFNGVKSKLTELFIKSRK